MEGWWDGFRWRRKGNRVFCGMIMYRGGFVSSCYRVVR